MCQNRPDVGNVIPITRLRSDCFTFAKHAMWLVCIDILKIVNWKCTVSVEIHNNSSLSSGSRADIANQKSYHDEKSTWQCFTCVFCPRLIRNVRSRRRFDSSPIIAYPVNFDIQRGRSLKCDAKNSTYIYILIDRYHPLDNRYGFSISVQLEIFSMLKKQNVFQKLAGLWLVGEVVNHVGLYGSKVAEGCSAFERRSCCFLWSLLADGPPFTCAGKNIC